MNHDLASTFSYQYANLLILYSLILSSYSSIIRSCSPRLSRIIDTKALCSAFRITLSFYDSIIFSPYSYLSPLPQSTSKGILSGFHPWSPRLKVVCSPFSYLRSLHQTELQLEILDHSHELLNVEILLLDLFFGLVHETRRFQNALHRRIHLKITNPVQDLNRKVIWILKKIWIKQLLISHGAPTILQRVQWHHV